MERRYVIEGGVRLEGEIEVSGAKNAVLPALSATILAKGVYKFKKVPRVRDVFCMLEILKHLGAKYEFKKNHLLIDTSKVQEVKIPYELATQIRASILFLGPACAVFKEALIPFPGGCVIGKRPVDFHLNGLKKLGAEITIEKGNIIAKGGNLKGAEIILDFPSVTATENLMMAGVLAEGETIIKNVAKEPEVVFLGKMLKKMGAEIKGLGGDKIYIKGKKELKPVSMEIIPDRIEAGTFLVLAGLQKGNEIVIKNFCRDFLEIPLLKLEEIGLKVEFLNKNEVLVKRMGSLNTTRIITAPYPGFPTDLQPIFTMLLTQAEGLSFITENLFENRFLYVPELNRMGANIKVEGTVAVVNGPTKLMGSPVKASDLRAGAALVLAGLCAEDITTIYNIEQIERGYEKLVEKLSGVGARIYLEEKN